MPPITPAPVDIPEDEAASVNLDSANIVPALSESDSESENIDHNGYELLPQDPESCFNVENDEDSSSDTEESATVEEKMLQRGQEISAILEFSASSTPSVPSIHDFSPEMITLDEERIETIKSVMKGITLPSSSLPQWASTVPEEEWKSALLSDMHSRKSEVPLHKKKAPSKLSMDNNNFEAMSDVLR